MVGCTIPAGMPLQWSRDLSVAETGVPPRPPHVGQVSRPFNGAATFQSRKLRLKNVAGAWPRCLPPSMEPRPFSRGNELLAAEGPAARRAGFNGAATFQSRKLDQGENVRTAMLLVQWSRDLSVAETRPSRPPCRRPGRFNGAATFQSRKLILTCDLQPERAASMEPRPFSRGNRKPGARLTSRMIASMEPRPFSRGNPSGADECGDAQDASMEPRPFSRGNTQRMRPPTPRTLSFNGAATFQSRKPDCLATDRAGVGRFNGAATFQSRKPHS